MHIAVDARELVGAATGAGRYLGQLLRHWDALGAARAHRFSLYAHAPVEPAAPSLESSVHLLPGTGGTRWEQLTLAAALRRDRPDVLFAPGYTSPLWSRTPTALAIHDVSFAAHPEWFRLREGVRRRVVTRLAARRARVVLTISDFSRTEIVKWLRVEAGRVRVVPPGLGLADVPDPDETVPREPVVLFVGSVFNRRHVPALIRAMPRVAARHPRARLAVVGDNRTYPHEDLAGIAAEAGVGSRVSIESFVSDEALRDRYRQAAVFVFLSEYEGFGLTPLEALASGVPVVVLDTPVAREIYGPAARYVARPDPDTVADAILALIDDGPARREVLDAAPAVLGRYRWSQAAALTLAAIEEAGAR